MALIDTFRSGDIVSLTFAFNVLDIDSASWTKSLSILQKAKCLYRL